MNARIQAHDKWVHWKWMQQQMETKNPNNNKDRPLYVESISS